MKYILYGETAKEVTKDVMINGEMVTMKVKDINPYTTMRLALDQEYFDSIRKVLSESNERDLAHYTFDPSKRQVDNVSGPKKESNIDADWDYNVL